MRRLRLTWPGDSQASLKFSRKARCWCWRHSWQYGKNEQRFHWKQFFDVFFEQSGSCFREKSGIQACWPLIPNILKEEAPIITSSATQGVGGSFKNRKPIGEVGCCESRMAERIHWWTEGGWSCVFGVVAMVAVVTSHTTAGCSVVECSCRCSCSLM